MRLSTKFIGLAIPGLLLCFTVGIILIHEKEKRDFIEQGREKSSLFASSIVNALQDNMLEGRPDITVRLLSKLREMEDIYELAILKEDGSHAFEKGYLRVEPAIMSAIKEGKDASFLREVRGKRAITLLRPIINEERCQRCHRDGRKIRGGLLISLSMEGVYKKIEANRESMVIYSIIFLFSIGLLSTLFIRRTLLKPISILREGTKRVGQGNLDYRTEVSSRDEFEDLANAFNDMAGRLKESYSLLEDKVAQRTKELSLLNYELEQLALLSTSVFRGNLPIKEVLRRFIDTIAHNLGYPSAVLYLIDKQDRSLKIEAEIGISKENLPEVVSLSERHFLSEITLEGKTVVLEWNPLFREAGSNLALIPILLKPVKRCWEEIGCHFGECPAYNNPYSRCWLMTETLCCSIVWEKAERGRPPHTPKIERCLFCPVFPLTGLLCVASLSAFSQDSLHTLEILASEIGAAMENTTLIEEIKKDKAFIEGVIFSMNSGLLLLDMDGTIQKINLVGSEILKGRINELTGLSIVERLPGSEEFLRVNSMLGRELNLRVMDGSVIPIGFSNSYLYSTTGEPQGIVVVFRDLTEIKALQRELRDKERFATIGRVAAGVAHEIRNPLSGISSVAQILKREVKGSTTHNELIDAMLSEINRLNSLVKELLVYSKPVRLNLKDVDIFKLINEVISFQGHVSGNCRISFRGDSGIPSIRVDPERVRQVLLNILKNAIDAGSSNIVVSLRRESAGLLSIRISDDGCGIPEEEIEKVFELFYTTKEKGTGLGLPICRRIMEDHGGGIEIESERGKGTTVTLRFPIARNDNRGSPEMTPVDP